MTLVSQPEILKKLGFENFEDQIRHEKKIFFFDGFFFKVHLRNQEIRLEPFIERFGCVKHLVSLLQIFFHFFKQILGFRESLKI